MAAARDNIVVLLREQKDLLQALLHEEGLLHSRDDGKGRVLDTERAKEIVEVLEGEEAKAARLEITLAVAGTVKAGKSTAINAIIGTEALPNRARPMTALPTVIRHELGRFEPRLTVNIAAALDDLAEKVAGKLRDKDCLAEVRAAHAVDMGELIDDLAKGRRTTIDAHYEGRDQVFETLGRINDLLRLGRHAAIGVTLAVEAYDDLHEMPSLDVHFRCLANSVQASGSLALLDLPGFNEARLSEQLTDVLEEQLEKASAILVVLDYTQLNTEASEELEMLLDAVSGMMANRIFVLVNKFDQHTSRDPDETDTKKHISTETMAGKVDSKHVYPVSARFAYLANRALEELNRDCSLPLPDDEPWIDDFRLVAFGRDKTKLDDPSAVRIAAEALWADSGFETMLNDVVVTARGRAAALAIRSALEKLKAYGDRIENHLNILDGSLTADEQDLENIINRINKDIETIEGEKDEFTSSQHGIVARIERNIEEKLEDANRIIDGRFEDLFNEEVEKIVEGKKSKNKNNKPDALIGLKDGQLIYYDVVSYNEATRQLRLIYAELANDLLNEFLIVIQAMVLEDIGKWRKNLVEKLEKISNKVQDKMSQAGFEVRAAVPRIQLDSSAVEAGSVRFSRHKRTKVKSGVMVTNRFWNEIDPFDWFGFGKEEFKYTEAYYVINRDQVVDELKKAMNRALRDFQESVEQDMLIWREDCEREADELRTSLDEYNQSLIDRKRQRSEDKTRLEQIVSRARRIKQKSIDNRANVQDFESATRKIVDFG